ncbi:hypothetical protein ABZT02_35490 [Streptomyces sp. NPDC005402]|uniref:hypothetical protein n=1 Tax=Streptomyces sp. NPDC005402 TaxID=3155338 RepID=UPI0033A08A38
MAVAALVVVAGLLLLGGGLGRACLNTLVTALILTLFTTAFALVHPQMSALSHAALVSAVLSGLGLTSTTDSASHVSVVEALGVCGLFGATTVYLSTTHSDKLWVAVAAAFLAVTGAVAFDRVRGEVPSRSSTCAAARATPNRACTAAGSSDDAEA